MLSKKQLKKLKNLLTKQVLTMRKRRSLFLTSIISLRNKQNIKLDMNLEDEKVIANKYDNTRLHAKLNDGKVSYSSQLQNLSKDSYPKLKIYRIDKSSYETRQNLDATSGATPRFEDNILDGKYYDIKKLLNNNQDRTSATNNKYEIDIKENDIKETSQKRNF